MSRATTMLRPVLVAAALAAALHAVPARAHGPSDASVLSALPVAVSVAAPVALFSAGAVLTVVAVEASAAGTVWVLERASDGARASVRLSGAVSAAAGTVVAVTALSTGWLLSAAGEAICFVPNTLCAALLYHERVTP